MRTQQIALLLAVLITSPSSSGAAESLSGSKRGFHNTKKISDPKHQDRLSQSTRESFSPPPPPPVPETGSISINCAELNEKKSRFAPTKRRGLINTITSAAKRQRHQSSDQMQPQQKLARLSGGAEEEVNVETAGESSTFSSAADTTTPRAFLGTLRQHSKKTIFPKLAKMNTDTIQKVKDGLEAFQATSTKVAPSFLTLVSVLWSAEKGISFLSLYAVSLLGASCGFYLFLYFITVGYAIGVTLPLIAALHMYKSHGTLSRPTLFHSYITVAWGVRILLFFLWREYVSWPALHQKVVELQSKMDIPFSSRLLCWLVYSFFYVAMMTSNWSRLSQNGKWGIVGYAGLLFQIGGLLLETIADMQKNGFKSRHRHSWCNVGVWKFSTHPNYLGEGLFWWGTYLAHGFDSILHSLLATAGLVFVMTVLKGSTRSLSRTHLEKYGDQPEFFEFQRTHSIWGPKKFWWWVNGLEELSKKSKVQATTPVVSTSTLHPDDNTTSTAALEEASVQL